MFFLKNMTEHALVATVKILILRPFENAWHATTHGHTRTRLVKYSRFRRHTDASNNDCAWLLEITLSPLRNGSEDNWPKKSLRGFLCFVSLSLCNETIALA